MRNLSVTKRYFRADEKDRMKREVLRKSLVLNICGCAFSIVAFLAEYKQLENK